MPGQRPHRGGRPSRPGSRGRGSRGRVFRGKGGRPTQNHNGFGTSRLREVEDAYGSDNSSADEQHLSEEERNDHSEQPDDESASEVEALTTNSYATLLVSLNARQQNGEASRKKRKTSQAAKVEGSDWTPADSKASSIEENQLDDAEEAKEQSKELEEALEEDEEQEYASDQDANSEAEEFVMGDPFEKHYTMVTEQDLKDAVTQVDEKQWQWHTSAIVKDVRRTVFSRNGSTVTNSVVRSVKDLSLKRRLLEPGSKAVSSLSAEEKLLASSLFSYTDILSGCRNLKNTPRLRDICCLHALNHVFKTRDRVLKNNMKLNIPAGSESLDLRDQGFTRPKVLIVVPTKQACVRFVDSIVKLSEPDQQENKTRFLETYSHEDEKEWRDKPEDFRELFGGNHEEDFRIGLKFTRKTIKFFSGFYNSDIILGSALGLMRTITTGGGGGKDKKKAHDADFLSSIEVVIVDQANALAMQNWQHVDYVFSQLNLLPKDSHGCDFSRVRHWYLDGRAKYLRQTILLSDYLTPEINALASSHLHNISGRLKLVPSYAGAMLAVSAIPLPEPPTQTFLRFPSPTPLSDSDARFTHFTTVVLPPLLRNQAARGVLLFIPTYADFTRLRNHLSTSPEATSLSFGAVSEYTPKTAVLRARSHFLSGRHALLLYSERAHHYFRYRIKGVRRLVFYGVPENPVFWTEMVALLGPGLGMGGEGEKNRPGKDLVRALFSKWDALKLERIVGTERVQRLINDRGGDTFEFV